MSFIRTDRMLLSAPCNLHELIKNRVPHYKNEEKFSTYILVWIKRLACTPKGHVTSNDVHHACITHVIHASCVCNVCVMWPAHTLPCGNMQVPMPCLQSSQGALTNSYFIVFNKNQFKINLKNSKKISKNS